MNETNRSPARRRWLVLILMSIVILVPSVTGFVMKFIEFVHTYRDRSDGVFAITPITNYLLASIGFFCMLIWAAVNGMFRDIEQPKYRMLDVEHELDRAGTGRVPRSPSEA